MGCIHCRRQSTVHPISIPVGQNDSGRTLLEYRMVLQKHLCTEHRHRFGHPRSTDPDSRESQDHKSPQGRAIICVLGGQYVSGLGTTVFVCGYMLITRFHLVDW